VSLSIIGICALLIFWWDGVRPFIYGVKNEVFREASRICRLSARSSNPESDLINGTVPYTSRFESNAKRVHPTVVLDYSGRVYESRFGLGDDWNPDSLNDLELVLCIRADEDDVIYGDVYCRGTDYGYRHIPHKVAYLYEALTGDFVYKFNLRVSDPCTGNSETNLTGLRRRLEDFFVVQ